MSSHNISLPSTPLPKPNGEIFIDHGEPLPERYEGDRLRAMLRDPGTLFVYWELPEGVEENGRKLSVLDDDGAPLMTCILPAGMSSVYLYLDAGRAARVRLDIKGEPSREEAVIDPATSASTHPDRWVFIDPMKSLLPNGAGINESDAAAPGRAWSPDGNRTWTKEGGWSTPDGSVRAESSGAWNMAGLPSSQSFVLRRRFAKTGEV